MFIENKKIKLFDPRRPRNRGVGVEQQHSTNNLLTIKSLRDWGIGLLQNRLDLSRHLFRHLSPEFIARSHRLDLSRDSFEHLSRHSSVWIHSGISSGVDSVGIRFTPQELSVTPNKVGKSLVFPLSPSSPKIEYPSFYWESPNENSDSCRGAKKKPFAERTNGFNIAINLSSTFILPSDRL